jgi:hypothetical protein
MIFDSGKDVPEKTEARWIRVNDGLKPASNPILKRICEVKTAFG